MTVKAWAYRKLRRFSNTLKQLRPKGHIEFFYAHDLQDIPTADARVDVKIHLLQPGEEHKIREIWPVSAEKVRSRLQQGDLCFLGVVGGKPVSYHWVQTRGDHFVQPTGKYMPLNGKQFMIYHTRVTEEYKGQRINPFIICSLLRDMRKEGFSQGLIYTASTNISNQKSLERIGFEKIEEVKSTRVGNRFYSNWKATI